ncbi:MAG: type II secretion system protein [Patescibacteria group bacterium]
MLQKLQKRKEGFTIIEVLIVLAIAGLILLVVFLAVPALQRNSRNTQRKNEVSAILGGINEWANNNSGKLPTTAAERTAALANSKLSFYTTGNVTWVAAGANSASTEHVQIATGAKCNGGDSTATGASGRQLALMYTVETGGGTQELCQDS